MTLALQPPLEPMLADSADEVPHGAWLYEPKWDGFRVLVFRDGDALELLSRDGKPLLRYFPELAGPIRAALPEAAVVDGEIVIARGGVLDFDLLQTRLHPAKSRIDKLAGEIPAALVLFDWLADAEDGLALPLAERRRRLVERVKTNDTVQITPASLDRAVAEDWFARFRGAGLDGVMAKSLDGAYQPGKRLWVKVKHQRTLDAAVVGFRWHKDAPGAEVGSLVLALYDADGAMHPIGVCASFAKKRRATLLAELEPWRDAGAEHPWARWAGAEHRPDVKSRWSGGKDLAWEPLRLGLVAEVHTTQHDGYRLRHPAKLVRLRTDKAALDCSTEQLKTRPAGLIGELFG